MLGAVHFGRRANFKLTSRNCPHMPLGTAIMQTLSSKCVFLFRRKLLGITQFFCFEVTKRPAVAFKSIEKLSTFNWYYKNRLNSRIQSAKSIGIKWNREENFNFDEWIAHDFEVDQTFCVMTTTGMMSDDFWPWCFFKMLRVLLLLNHFPNKSPLILFFNFRQIASVLRVQRRKLRPNSTIGERSWSTIRYIGWRHSGRCSRMQYMSV